ncbi:hypothetical protein ACGTN9_17495 [Halobacillus sp. MO56]
MIDSLAGVVLLMKKFLINLFDTNQYYFYILILVIMMFLFNKYQILNSILTYLFLILIYTKIIRSSIQKANTILKQIAWLLFIPALISLLPFVPIESLFPNIVHNDYFFISVFIIFFTLSWVLAVFVFDLHTIKVAIQVINALFLSILSITFLLYFTSDALVNLLSKEIIVEMQKENLGIETFLDLLIKAITIPYVLAGIWANVGITYKEYLVSKKCE